MDVAPIIIFPSKKDEETVTKLRAVFLNPHKIIAPPVSLVIKTVK